MSLFSCEHPKRIFNKYTGEWVAVSCNECASCRHARASHWIGLLEQERMSSVCTFFVTLTYTDDFLPKMYPNLSFDDPQMKSYIFNKDVEFVSNRSHDDKYSIKFSDFDFAEKSDLFFFHHWCKRWNGIPYASFSDIQLFHKRLNKWFKNYVTGSFKNFRYFVVSEYGSTTNRPHFHCLYFINDTRLISSFEDGILACWKYEGVSSLGRVDCQSVENSACSYVAQYVNCLFDLPSFYKISPLRPKFVCSKSPSLGNGYQSVEDLQEIFDSGAVETCCRRVSTAVQLTNVPLQSAVKNRLYPRIIGYRSVSDSLRTQLYRLSLTCYERFGVEKFDDFYFLVRELTHIKTSNGLTSELYFYLSKLYDGSLRCVDRLRRLWYVSRKVCKNAAAFRISVESYVNRIVLFYDKFQLYVLRRFYLAQSDMANHEPLENLVLAYPEYALRNDVWHVLSTECLAYQRFCDDSRFMMDKHTKSHKKNVYIESCNIRDKLSFNIIKNFYNAKKCNEINEIFA